MKELAERFDREHIAIHVKASAAKEYRFKLVQAAAKTWRRLKRANQLP